jgi:NADH-quinone oxidoreductase subunit J
MNVAVNVLMTVLTVAFSLMVVFSKRTVVAAFSLLMTLLCIGVVYFLLGSNFLSAAQVLINAGAIAILFVFVMMLINLEQFDNKHEKSKIKLILTTFSILVSMGVLILIINNNVDVLNIENLKENTMTVLFDKLFTVYYLPFELATMLLLASIVAVVVLTGHYKIKQEE